MTPPRARAIGHQRPARVRRLHITTGAASSPAGILAAPPRVWRPTASGARRESLLRVAADNEKAPFPGPFLMERTGFEPVTSSLQS
jgi:hypothetical protein